jgi:4-carboxymuconolactone decarboxylase
MSRKNPASDHDSSAPAAEADGASMSAQQAYIDDMVRKRGYVLDYHKYMAHADYDVLKAANNLVDAVYLRQRRLDRKTKELLFIVSLTVVRADKAHIRSHIKVALELGLSPEEVLEALEITLPEAGVVVFQEGLEAWREEVNATALEPSDEALSQAAQP